MIKSTTVHVIKLLFYLQANPCCMHVNLKNILVNELRLQYRITIL